MSAASSASAHPHGAVREVFSNGCVLLTKRIRGARHASLCVAVRIGSRYEPLALAGISHLLEHMLFRGTKEHPTSYAQNFAFESLGGTLDAATSVDSTVYQATLPPEAVPTAIELIAEMFRAPVMAHLTLERNVVREEILDTLDENDQLVDADELTAQALFGKEGLARPIGGTLKSIDAITEADLRAWHASHYVGANLVCVVAGAFPASTRATFKKTFGALPAGTKAVRPPLSSAKVHRETFTPATGSQVDVRVAFRAPLAARSPRSMAFSMLSRILDDGMSARVFRTLVEDRGLAYEAFGGLDIYPDVAALVLGASCRPESTALAVEALLELAREVRESVSKEELQRVRTRVRFELDLLRDDPQAMGEILLEDEFHGEATSLDEIARRAAAVTTKDVVRVAQQFLTPEALAVVAVGRLESGVLRKLKKAARGFA